MSESEKAGGARRRAGRSSGSVRTAPSTLKYRKLKHRFPPTPVVSEDELEAIHNASLTILEEMGMDFMHVEARERLKAADADVAEIDAQIAESREHAGQFQAVLAKAAKRFAALAKVEERHANQYRQARQAIATQAA